MNICCFPFNDDECNVDLIAVYLPSNNPCCVVDAIIGYWNQNDENYCNDLHYTTKTKQFAPNTININI